MFSCRLSGVRGGTLKGKTAKSLRRCVRSYAELCIEFKPLCSWVEEPLSRTSGGLFPDEDHTDPRKTTAKYTTNIYIYDKWTNSIRTTGNYGERTVKFLFSSLRFFTPVLFRLVPGNLIIALDNTFTLFFLFFLGSDNVSALFSSFYHSVAEQVEHGAHFMAA